MDAQLRRDIDRVIKGLNAIQKKQVPFAISVALNKVATDAQRRAQRRARTDLDRPTPFTLRGIRVERSSKTNLTAAVYIQEIQSDYLRFQISGGQRKPKRRAVVIPVSLRRNKYGNIPRGKIKALLNRDDVFVVRDSSKAGIYQRSKTGKLKMLIAFAKGATYERRWPFDEIVINEAKTRIVPATRQALQMALATAK